MKIFKPIKKLLRLVQGFLEKYVLGNFIQNCIWKSKHLLIKNWEKNSLESNNDYNRELITSEIVSFDNVQSVLEIGCAAAPILRHLREKLPSAKLTGIDINKQAIRVANDYFQSINDEKVNLLAITTDQLDYFQDKSFDIVFTQALLISITPPNINKVISEMFRLSRKAIIFNEYHLDGAEKGFFADGRWVYDYYSIIKKQYPEAKISMKKSDYKGGNWDLYGKLITVKL